MWLLEGWLHPNEHPVPVLRASPAGGLGPGGRAPPAAGANDDMITFPGGVLHRWAASDELLCGSAMPLSAGHGLCAGVPGTLQQWFSFTAMLVFKKIGSEGSDTLPDAEKG